MALLLLNPDNSGCLWNPDWRFRKDMPWALSTTRGDLGNGPDGHCLPPPAWDYLMPCWVALSCMDNGFTGWDRSATILAEPASLRSETSVAFRKLQVFILVWLDFFCVEPVTHVPNAFNRPRSAGCAGDACIAVREHVA